MKRNAPLALLLALAAGLVLPSAAGAAPTSAARVRGSDFALSGSGFGSHAVGGQVPVGSGRTAYQVIGCTNRTGLSHTNDVARVKVPGFGTISDLTTRVWTTQSHGVVASHARHTIGSVALASTPLGTLSLSGIVSAVRTSHDSTGFHATTTTDVGAITLTPTTGPSQTFPAPSPGTPVAIPGVATVYAGPTVTRTSSTAAFADAFGIRVVSQASGTRVSLAHARSSIGGGVVTGIFHGHSDATRVTAVQGNLRSGPNPLTLMPCQGTHGTLRRSSVARVDLGGQLVLSGLSSEERGAQTASRAHGFERARVGRIDLGGGQLVVDGIIGRAAVIRTAHGVVRTAKGTQIGTITANGQVQTFPPTGALEIPGVAKLQRHLVHKTASGLTVTALRITLLDGSGAVINLGEAQLRIARPFH